MVAAHVEANEKGGGGRDEQECAYEVDLCCAFDPMVVRYWWEMKDEVYCEESEGAHWCLRQECPVSVTTDLLDTDGETYHLHPTLSANNPPNGAPAAAPAE